MNQAFKNITCSEFSLKLCKTLSSLLPHKCLERFNATKNFSIYLIKNLHANDTTVVFLEKDIGKKILVTTKQQLVL